MNSQITCSSSPQQVDTPGSSAHHRRTCWGECESLGYSCLGWPLALFLKAWHSSASLLVHSHLNTGFLCSSRDLGSTDTGEEEEEEEERDAMIWRRSRPKQWTRSKRVDPGWKGTKNGAFQSAKVCPDNSIMEGQILQASAR